MRFYIIILLVLLASCKSHKVVTEQVTASEKQTVTENVVSSSTEQKNTEKNVTSSESEYEIVIEYSEPDENGKQHIKRKKIKGKVSNLAEVEQTSTQTSTKTESKRQTKTKKDVKIKSEKETKQTSGGIFAWNEWEVALLLAAILCIVIWCRTRKKGYL